MAGEAGQGLAPPPPQPVPFWGAPEVDGGAKSPACWCCPEQSVLLLPFMGGAGAGVPGLCEAVHAVGSKGAGVCCLGSLIPGSGNLAHPVWAGSVVL